MKLALDLATWRSRLVGYAVVWALFALVVGVAVWQFVPAAAASGRVPMTLPMLEAAVRYFPHSAPVHARLAASLIEGDSSLDESHDEIAARAYRHAALAAQAAPANYEYRILLSAAAEQRGDLQTAESALRAAAVLAPANLNVNWQLANFLLRVGKRDDSLKFFQAYTTGEPGKLPTVLNLLWEAPSDKDAEKVDALRAVAGPSAREQFTLAVFFLLQANRPREAGQIAGAIKREDLLALPDGGRLIDGLLNAGEIDLAYDLWRRVAVGETGPAAEAVWNGGFETPVRTGWTQFDWTLAQSRFARIQTAPGEGHSGQRALRIAYQGVNTTRFDDEMRQVLRVAPGARYRLSCFVKANALAGPEPGPQIAISQFETKAPLAASAPVAAGTYDWQPLSVEFDVPPGSHAVLLSIKQTPALSYVEATTGTVWFDDFMLTRQ